MRVYTVAMLVLLTACGGKHPGTYEAATATAQPAEDLEAKLEEAREAWEGRIDDATLARSLALYEEVAAADPTNREAIEHLVRGWYFYGDAFTTERDLQLERWAKSIQWGTRCLALNPDFAAQIQGGARERDAVAVATKDDVHCLYWTATALGKWARPQGLATMLRHINTVKAYVGKVEELEPSFYYYGPARYWGAYYAALPGFAGKDLEKSAEYLAASIEGAPDFLGTRVIRAEFLAVELQDVAMFDRELDAVLAADPAELLPEVVAENTKEQDKARELLNRRGELFMNPPPRDGAASGN